MSNKIEIVGDGVVLSDDIKKYIYRKMAKLDRYMPRHARKSSYIEVKMRENTHRSHQNSNKYECEAIVHLPHGPVAAKEATLNMFAAVDIVETKLRNQLRRYKAQAAPRRKGNGRERMRTALKRLGYVGRK